VFFCISALEGLDINIVVFSRLRKHGENKIFFPGVEEMEKLGA